jgi:arylsulfatase A-like enzyme
MSVSKEPKNILLIFLDSLRRDHVGAYGNPWIATPNLDAFARESVRMTRAYPESLPTLPVRRAVYTGLRTYPYRNHREYKGDVPGIAMGWGPIPEEQDTIAELLSAIGYRTALITDDYHQFKPSKNFARGFHEWVLIRGQEIDKFRSGAFVADSEVAKHLPAARGPDSALALWLRANLRNASEHHAESDTFPAQVFREASRWIEQNSEDGPFLLIVDSFDPHEPWMPPVQYRRLYDPDDAVADVIHSVYGPVVGHLTTRELKRLQANYAGNVTLVDRWFGEFMTALEFSAKLDQTVVAVISDHGHNLGFPGDQGLVGKQGHPMTPAVAELVMMIRHPEKEHAGRACDALVYNLDLTETLLKLAGVQVGGPRFGKDFWGVVSGATSHIRTHVTIGWGPLITVLTDECWYNASIWGEDQILYHLPEDRKMERNVALDQPAICAQLRGLAIEDAGGSIHEGFAEYRDRINCTPYEDRSLFFERLFGLTQDLEPKRLAWAPPRVQ